MRRTAAPSQLNNSIVKIPKLEIIKSNPLEVVYPSNLPDQSIQPNSIIYFSVAYGKPSKKKHKTWDGDGYLSISDSKVKLIDNEGKEIGSSIKKQLSKVVFEEGATFHIGGKYVEILSVVNKMTFDIKESIDTIKLPDLSKLPSFINREFRPVMSTLNDNKSITKIDDSNVDCTDCRQIIMPRPPACHIFKYNQSCSPIREVILDQQLSSRMRPHQIDGVIFLYECVLDMRSNGNTGVILADAMGLGKTVQVIALIWTLLNQGPYEVGGLIKRCIVVCPSSLVLNWRNEFDKWIGNNRIKLFCVTGDIRVEKFLETPSNSVLILSYEMLTRNTEVIQDFMFDLIVCDEAHRLKNTNNKTYMCVESLRIPRRILLTGTPLQNDMDEFFALVEFTNPGVLGFDKEAFRKRFVNPISIAREPNASQDIVDRGHNISLCLQRITQSFILRRTELVNTRYLPPKDEYIIFCSATQMQLQLYNVIIKCQTVQKHLNNITSSGAGIDAISCILLLRKLCNDPILLIQYVLGKENNNNNNISDDEREPDLIEEIHKNLMALSKESEVWSQIISSSTDVTNGQIYSGKLWVTAQMLMVLPSDEKIVLTSHFTKTLNMLQTLCTNLGLHCHRIDGHTPSSTRINIVNNFNKVSNKPSKEVLLLSCKAGGEGLNLIGASKIILYDLDWNPAIDSQTMARVWRDGQKGRVAVYRLVTTGTVEESMLQRQVMKQQLSTSIVDLAAAHSNKRTFSKDELKDIFSLHCDSTDNFGCWTHQLLNCSCQNSKGVMDQIIELDHGTTPLIPDINCQLGLKQLPLNTSSIAQLNNWSHWIGEHDIVNNTTDSLILSAANQISCVFIRTINTEDK